MGEGGVVADNSYQALAIPPRYTGDEFMKRAGGGNIVFASTCFFAENDLYADIRHFAMDSPAFSSLGGQTGVLLDASHKDTSNSDLQASGFLEQHPGDEIFRYRQERDVNPPSARYKSMMPSKLPKTSISSTYFTIPPGFSPTMLLASPRLFSNASSPLADLSPASGSFLSSFNSLESKVARADNSPKVDGFVFRPHPVVAKAPNVIETLGASHWTDLEEDEKKPMMPKFVPRHTPDAQSLEADRSDVSFANVFYLKPQQRPETTLQMPNTDPVTASDRQPLDRQLPYVTRNTTSLNRRTTLDGYNWKKYGQKQLKGTDLPRSYYKCTYPNCPVKKHVECSHEGEITEITYKGEHNHPKPQSTRRSSKTAVHVTVDTSQRGGPSQSLEAGFDNMESDKDSADFSASSVVISHTTVAGTPEQSFCSPNDEECDDEDSEEEQDSKRRKVENVGEMASSHSLPIRTVREPRVVVQTVSEIDILDDGYRWRKYGQKVVKGHSFPRSYYKCTNIGCGVRKHVERSSDDPKSVRTTYEGKHNHNVPLTRIN